MEEQTRKNVIPFEQPKEKQKRKRFIVASVVILVLAALFARKRGK